MTTYSLTKAGAHCWLNAHLGATVATVQSDDRGTTWEPQPRTLSRQFKTAWLLDGSTVKIDDSHRVLALTDDSLTLGWYYDDGRLIHRTTYTILSTDTNPKENQ